MIFTGEPVDLVDEEQHTSGWCGCAGCKVAASGSGHGKASRVGVPVEGEAGA